MSNGPKITIERCKLQYACGQAWDELERLPSSERVRFCGRCQSAVHLVQHAGECATLAAQGKCVAMCLPDRAVRVGRPEPPRCELSNIVSFPVKAREVLDSPPPGENSQVPKALP